MHRWLQRKSDTLDEMSGTMQEVIDETKDAWVDIEEPELVTPEVMQTPVEVEVPLESIAQLEQAIREENPDVQNKYYENLLCAYLEPRYARLLGSEVVNTLRVSLEHPALLLRLMLLFKTCKVPGETKKAMVKQIYLEVHDGPQWSSRLCDAWIEELTQQLPNVFGPRKCCNLC